MSNSPFTAALRNLFADFHQLRVGYCYEDSIRNYKFGFCRGQIDTLYELGCISFEQSRDLSDLCISALFHSGQSYPGSRAVPVYGIHKAAYAKLSPQNPADAVA